MKYAVMKNKLLYLFIAFSFASESVHTQTIPGEFYKEQYRPQIHFSPKEKWMNDPNGLVYFNGNYHMFFQHYPDSTIWGPMHWGHAISKDLVHWKQLPIALFPDSLGYIYSGSVVVDSNNTSGFGGKGNIPLVAIFTHSNPFFRKAGRKDYQYQSIAYSLDKGYTWTKYAGNPVLNNPGIKDFRDPKVCWYKPAGKWIMTLATKDRVTFYSSSNLKQWSKESEFGQDMGAHGGVWECPDLLAFDDNGKTVWSLLVSINPGGPNGGSATQYFVGDFDGKNFSPYDTITKWVDYGTDNYAGVTFHNTAKRKLFIGWMSNWQYANKVPTVAWRSAMTLARELSIKEINHAYYLASTPVSGYKNIQAKELVFNNINLEKGFDLSGKIKSHSDQYQISISAAQLEGFAIHFSNDVNEKLVVGFNKSANQFYIDRTRSGKTDFEKGFAKIITAPRISNHVRGDVTLILDASSVELFADDGATVMTAIFFPGKGYSNIKIKSDSNFFINSLRYSALQRIW